MKRHAVAVILALCAVSLLLQAPAFADAEAGKPKAVAPEPVKDMGMVPKGEKIVHDFLIRNEGTAPLEITEVRPACGCTVASFDKTVAPGQLGKIHVVIDSDTFAGPIAKGVTAFTNDVENPQIELTVKANVQPLIRVEPGYARYVIVQGEEKEGTIVQTLWASDDAPMEVTGVQSPYPFLKVSYHEAKPDEMLPEGKGRQWKVEMTLDRDAPVGALGDFVRVTTTHPKQKLVEIPISGFVRPVIAVTPPVADFGRIELKEPQVRSLVIRAFSTEPIKVTSIEGNIKGLEAKLEPRKEGREYDVRLTLTPEIAKGPFSGKLTIHTDSPKKPLIEVDLRGIAI
jgi:Protein of unknown function (DUF1573)